MNRELGSILFSVKFLDDTDTEPLFLAIMEESEWKWKDEWRMERRKLMEISAGLVNDLGNDS